MPTESQLRDTALRALISKRIDAGELPVVLSRTISIGPGSGLKCLACLQPIRPEHIEYHAFGVKYGTAVRLHWGCHVLWQLECLGRARRQGGERPQDLPQQRKAAAREGNPPDGELPRWAWGPAAPRWL